ncbi:MAG: hypothetical protein ACYC96_08660 [Fimbriimonadaceae bacterium]
MLSRRELLKSTAYGGLVLSGHPLVTTLASRAAKPVRCLNIVNFIRGVEPRAPTDLLLPVIRQMDEIVRRRLPASWLLQYDALVQGPFVEALKRRMPADHEVGFWFEMNERLVDAAKVEWRGRPGFEWDSHPSVAFSIGYTEDERVKLVDAAMAGFKSVWHTYPRSVASWNLDAVSMAHLSERYGVDAFAVCRDQIATDGFTIWGAPIAGYFPSKLNCWSPALSRHNQLSTPVFRMLGQDPVYYYYRRYPLPDGRLVGEPDTMEPVWTSGRSPTFVKAFLDMISASPCSHFAYGQLGQENSFGWPDMAQAYPQQLDALAQLRDQSAVHVETLGETGLRFKAAFRTTPVQSQIMLDDPYGNNTPAQQTVWYQSRFYRANLHFAGDLPYLRDVTVYSDRFSQPFLTEPTRDSDVEQRMPAVLDGYHWAAEPGALGEPRAGGYLTGGGERVRLTAPPSVSENGDVTTVDLPTRVGGLRMRFEERALSITVLARAKATVGLEFEWDRSKATLPVVRSDRATYTQGRFAYAVHVAQGVAAVTDRGWSVSSSGQTIRLRLAQND